MYEYKCICVRVTAKDTEGMLNSLSMNGWKLVCSYSSGNYLILKRELKGGDK